MNYHFFRLRLRYFALELIHVKVVQKEVLYESANIYFYICLEFLIDR